MEINLIIDIQNSSCDMCWWVGGGGCAEAIGWTVHVKRREPREAGRSADSAHLC